MSRTVFTIPIDALGKDSQARVEQSGKSEGDFPLLGYHAKMAALAGAFVLICAVGLSVLVLWFIPAIRSYWSHFLVVSVGAGSCVSAWFGFNWVREAATRLWRITDQERARRHKLEDKALEGDNQEEEENRGGGWQLELTGYKILIMHYVQGLACTRPEAEAAGINQGDWNRCNDIFKALKIKGERKWLDVPMEDALSRWDKDTWFENDGRVRTRIEKGHWQEVKGEK
jgi:hypothetical protein